MSNITISGNASGTATFTVQSPATNTNQTLTLPDATTTLVGTDATQTLTNKTIDASQLTGNVAAARITTALNASGSAPIYAARAWVNFNGTGTVAIRSSGNVTSITDNGVGSYALNFTTALADTNYAIVTSGSYNNTITTAGNNGNPSSHPISTSQCAVFTSDVNLTDMLTVSAAVFR